jgi:hypothetical protein
MSIDAAISTTTTTQAMMIPSLRSDDKRWSSADAEALVLLVLGPTISPVDEGVEVDKNPEAEVTLSGISALE